MTDKQLLRLVGGINRDISETIKQYHDGVDLKDWCETLYICASRLQAAVARFDIPEYIASTARERNYTRS